MDAYALILRNIAGRIGLTPLKDIAAQPTVKAVFRVTVYHPETEITDAVSTLVAMAKTIKLSTVYAGRLDHQPLTRQFDGADYDAFVQALSKLRFDRLPDQPFLPVFNASLCLVERGAGTFVKDVIFSPDRATDDYGRLLEVLQQFLPEAFREVK